MSPLFEKLIAWQEAYGLSLLIYRITQNFPDHEKFGLTSQMRRAASSVPINLAEGNAKSSKKDRARYVEIAFASLQELHCECMLARDLGCLSQSDFVEVEDKLKRTSYLIHHLLASLR